MFGNKKRKIAIQKLEDLQVEYKYIGLKANEIVLHLYSARKDASYLIDKIENCLDKNKNIPNIYIVEIAEARASISDFRDAIELEEKELPDSFKENMMGETVAGIGVATGVGIATLGPTAAMAIATTFGTASTGAAISSLTGVAATNAALAWLGGGTLALGGGGIAAGNAFLALAGPVGWALGGLTILGGGMLKWYSNHKITKEVNQKINDLESEIRTLNCHVQSLKESLEETKKKCLELNSTIEVIIENNYTNLNDELIKKVVDLIKKLCKLINKRFYYG